MGPGPGTSGPFPNMGAQHHGRAGSVPPGSVPVLTTMPWRAAAPAVCGLFSLMNRLVEGLGITAAEGYFQVSANRLAELGCAGWRISSNRACRPRGF
jgi:hypothetical protein